MISTVAVDPFKFQSATVQSVKSNKSPGTYRTYYWKKMVQVALHDGLQSWNVSMSCLVGWIFKGGSYQDESGHSSWYLTKNMDKRAKTKVMLITWKNSPVHCFQLITIEIAMLSIGNRWKMTLGEFSKSVFGKWLRVPESQFHWCRGFFPQHYRRINWSIVETTTTQPPNTQGLVTCIISTVSTRTTSSVDPYGEGQHIKMKHGKTRCDKNWKWTESGETLGIIETWGSSSYVSDHIYKHLQAIPFFPPHNGFSHFTPGFSSHEHLPAENVFHGTWSRSNWGGENAMGSNRTFWEDFFHEKPRKSTLPKTNAWGP